MKNRNKKKTKLPSKVVHLPTDSYPSALPSKVVHLPTDLYPSVSIESGLKKLIKEMVNEAVSAATKEPVIKKEKEIFTNEKRVVGNIQRIINTDMNFQDKVRELYISLSREIYNISKTANKADSVSKIDVSEEISDKEKLRDIAMKKKLIGAVSIFYPNETMAPNDARNHIDEKRLENRLIEIQSSLSKSKTKKTKVKNRRK